MTIHSVSSVLVRCTSSADVGFLDPAVDGSFAPALPGNLLLHGQYDKSLKVLIGHTTNEGLYFTSPFLPNETTFKQNIILASFPDAEVNGAADYIQTMLYPPVFDGSYHYTNQIARGDYVISEALFACNANYLARTFGNRAYSYIFSVLPALHGADVAYTFYEGPAASVTNDTLALTMQSYFMNFVAGGNPNGGGLPPFPTYGQGGMVQNFNLTSVTTVPESADGLSQDRCAWWQKALYF